jgi:hypothetical protein
LVVFVTHQNTRSSKQTNSLQSTTRSKATLAKMGRSLRCWLLVHLLAVSSTTLCSSNTTQLAPTPPTASATTTLAPSYEEECMVCGSIDYYVKYPNATVQYAMLGLTARSESSSQTSESQDTTCAALEQLGLSRLLSPTECRALNPHYRNVCCAARTVVSVVDGSAIFHGNGSSSSMNGGSSSSSSSSSSSTNPPLQVASATDPSSSSAAAAISTLHWTGSRTAAWLIAVGMLLSINC